MASVSLAKLLPSQSVAAPAESLDTAARAAFICDDELNASSVRCFRGGTPVCLQVPVSKTRTSTQWNSERLSFSYHGGQSKKKNSSTVFRNGIFINAAPSTTEESALIDVEDETDGSILFKYGGLEDIWELDKVLEFLCKGAFSTYNIESLVPVIVELLKVPISASGQRRIVELLSSYIRTNCTIDLCEAEKMVSQILAEATSEFLPPATTGHFKGRRRPMKRFSSRVDKWWQKVDSFLGVGEEDLEFWGDDEFRLLGDRNLQAEPLFINESLPYRNSHGCTPLKAIEVRPLENVQTPFTWKDSPTSVNWTFSHVDSLLVEAPKKLEFVTDQDSRYNLSGENHTAGAGIVLLSCQVTALEDVLQRSEQAPNTCPSDVRRKPPPSFSKTLPASSVQDMIQWEQEEEVVTPVSLPNKKGQSKKIIQTNQRIRSKSAHQRYQSKVASSRSATKKRSNSEKVREKKLFDIFFTLPLNHSNSGVANFLHMRKGLSNEILTVLNQGSVVLAGGGLAVVLHVAARMLSINSTFDRYKLFGLIRGAALIWLSAAMQKLRSFLLVLPTECGISNNNSKKQLLSLQHQLRTLSFKALVVVVLSVVGTGT